MCGRYVVTKAVTDLLPDLLGDFADLPDDYNVAPTDLAPIVRLRHGERTAPLASWGFRASWMTEKQKRPINARIETVATAGMWRRPFAQARCIVPALGYYEWTVTPTGKQPHFISDPGSALAMAGLVGAWLDPSKDEDDPDRWQLSMAVITRDAHVSPGEVHDRMPACLTPDAYDDWLGDELTPDELVALLDRSSLDVAHELTHYEVSKAVNSVRNDGPELIRPL
ncbi:MAG: response-associated peptidase [Naasia sp.]|jgi:putative SOS response-associated peptidase YedK|uniref:SOS response-associated peptidase n=1 Tax=Naasia sp. TaxID=2546198 RepID=UPI00261B2AAE|nr:SOS response-associated peptidase [Naasia sp.]MCU1570509.1 response-associated peptidase [Naasia sp.]